MSMERIGRGTDIPNRTKIRVRALHVFVILAILVVAFPMRARADVAPKPLLFFHAGGEKIGLGDEYTEIEYRKVLGEVHDRMIGGLATTFGTTIVDHDFHAVEPSGRDLASACAQSGAAGAIEFYDSFGPGAGETFRGAFTLAVLDCTGADYFSETGASVHGPGKEVISEVLLPAMEDAYARLQKDVVDSPKANANYVRYGIYMTSEEADSFWLPTIEGKKTIVDRCDAFGTAYRAGLRPGDEVRSIDGVPTVGIDIDALNAAMSKRFAREPGRSKSSDATKRLARQRSSIKRSRGTRRIRSPFRTFRRRTVSRRVPRRRCRSRTSCAG